MFSLGMALKLDFSRYMALTYDFSRYGFNTISLCMVLNTIVSLGMGSTMTPLCLLDLRPGPTLWNTGCHIHAV